MDNVSSHAFKNGQLFRTHQSLASYFEVHIPPTTEYMLERVQDQAKTDLTGDVLRA